jgi:hypothetical protein
MKSNRSSYPLRSLSLKEALHQSNRWIVPDIDRKFLRPYHLLKKLTLEEQLQEKKSLEKQEVSIYASLTTLTADPPQEGTTETGRFSEFRGKRTPDSIT